MSILRLKPLISQEKIRPPAICGSAYGLQFRPNRRVLFARDRAGTFGNTPESIIHMSKHIRLNSAQHRAWSANTPQLVNSKGTPVKAVSPELEAQCEKVRREALKTVASVKKRIRFKEKNESGEETKQELTVEGRIKRYGDGPDQFRVFVFVEGMLKTSTRDIMLAQFFQTHGECQLARPNGKMLKIVRDPTRTITTPNPAALRQAPPPEQCSCREWGAPHPGKHHHICEYNHLAPADERSDGLPDTSEGKPSNVERLPVGVARVEPPKPAPLPVSPQDCPCRDWAKDDPDSHHPLCENKKAWETHASNRPTFNLVSLDSGETVREASEDEVAQAEIEAQQSGQMLININDAMYMVQKAEPSQPVDAPSEEVEPSNELPTLAVDSDGAEESEEVITVDDNAEPEPEEPKGPLAIPGLDMAD